MKAIVQERFGGPDVLELRQVPDPVVGENEVLVQVRAAGCGPDVWHLMAGKPYLARLSSDVRKGVKAPRGWDFAGQVESVGDGVTEFRSGDDVMGFVRGSFAELAVGTPDKLVRKPANITFEQAASVGVAAVTALQALRDHGRVKPGDKVAVVGASGGVGTFAVQVAKALGAEVTAVCSTRNVDLVRSLGADHVSDYTKEDFTLGSERYDVIVDMVGSHGLLEYRRVLEDDGRYVIVGGPDGKWLGPLASPLKAMLLSPFVEPEMGMMLAELNPADLALLAAMMQSGKLVPVVDRTYPLDQVRDAIAYLETSRARGKVVLTIATDR